MSAVLSESPHDLLVKDCTGKAPEPSIRKVLLQKVTKRPIYVIHTQGYHTVLIYKICPYFAVLRLRKYNCPYF